MFARHFTVLAIATMLVVAVNADIVMANNQEICSDLCTGCGGAPTYENGICDCRVDENDQKAIDCVRNIRSKQDQILDIDSSYVDQTNYNRDARCSKPGCAIRASPADVDRVVNYFASGGPLTGQPILGSSKADCDAKDAIVGASNEEDSEENIADEKPAKKIELPKGKSSLRSKASKLPAAEEAEKTEEAPVVGAGSPLLGGHRGLIGTPQFLQPRSQYAYGPITNAILGIPQAIVSAAIPGLLGSHHLGRARYSPILGQGIPIAVQPEPQMINEAAYVPRLSPAGMIHPPRLQLANPYLGIPNALLAGVQTPSYYPDLTHSPQAPRQFLRAEIPVETKPKTQKCEAAKKPKTESKESAGSSEGVSLVASNPVSGARTPLENDAAIRDALFHQNMIFRTTNQRLNDYNHRIVAPLTYPPKLAHNQPALGSSAPCNCADRGKVGASAPDSSVYPSADKIPEAPTKIAESKKKAAKPSRFNPKVGHSLLKKDKSPNEKAENDDSDESGPEDCDWQCLPKTKSGNVGGST